LCPVCFWASNMFVISRIIDLQMEGSSGSPGPTSNTTYLIRNLSVTQTPS